MRISIFGLGYVGSVSAACFADLGHHVIAVDKNEGKVEQVAAGQSPIVEAGVEARLARAVESGAIEATTDSTDAVGRSDVSIVAVGTPNQSSGDVSLTDLLAACGEIADGMRAKGEYHVVVVTSTVPPGTIESVVQPLLEERSGLQAGDGFGLCIVPEFLREGSAVDDFLHPAKTVIGAIDERSGAIAAELYGDVAAEVTRTSIPLAEMVKFTDNSWHALKVAFANEVARIADAHGVDSHELMRVFALDTKLNISAAYLRPGFSFGGSCLPKDVRTLAYRARAAGVEAPVIDAILASNTSHFETALAKITALGPMRVGLLGLSFKAGTDDLRESPVVELAERLLGKGYDLRVYDRNVSVSRLVGANRAFILRSIPHISEILLDSLDDVLDHAELVVVGNADPEFDNLAARIRPEQRVFDLVGVDRSGFRPGVYTGLTW